jgi:hypothetical protein
VCFLEFSLERHPAFCEIIVVLSLAARSVSVRGSFQAGFFFFIFLGSCFVVYFVVDIAIRDRGASCCILLGVGEFLRIRPVRLTSRGSGIGRSPPEK